MKEIKQVILKRDKVTLKIVDRDSYWGTIRGRQQITFNRRHFEAALRTAEIVVPWNQAHE